MTTHEKCKHNTPFEHFKLHDENAENMKFVLGLHTGIQWVTEQESWIRPEAIEKFKQFLKEEDHVRYLGHRYAIAKMRQKARQEKKVSK